MLGCSVAQHSGRFIFASSNDLLVGLLLHPHRRPRLRSSSLSVCCRLLLHCTLIRLIMFVDSAHTMRFDFSWMELNKLIRWQDKSLSLTLDPMTDG